MVTGYKTRKKRLRGTGGLHPSRPSVDSPSPKRSKSFRATGEGNGSRKVFDVWYTPTIKDVYAQFKVAEQMLSRVNDPSLAYVKRKVYEVEDLIWQFIQG